MGCISFFPSKNLGGFGDGGMVLTNDDRLARNLMALRVHGSNKKYYHEMIGINSRLDAMQAAILKVRFRCLEAWTAARQKNAELYRNLLRKSSAPVETLEPAPYQIRHVYNQLSKRGVGTEVCYPLPLHLQPCYDSLGYKPNSFPHSEARARESLALTVHPPISADDIEYISQAVMEFGQSSPERV